MILKLIGAMIVILGCGGYGFAIAFGHRRETDSLNQLLSALDFMHCELQYRLTPLPDLCRITAKKIKGPVKSFFEHLSHELEMQISPNVQLCIDAALVQTKTIPPLTAESLHDLSKSLGLFDLNGQLHGLLVTRDLTEIKLKKHSENQDIRIRSYQTLGICAGAAIAILFI